MNRNGCAAPVARFAVFFCLVFVGQSVFTTFGQIGRSKKGYVKNVPYTYNGQQFTIVLYGTQPAQVAIGSQVVLIISAGNVIAYPGVDAHLVANAQDALKAYQAGTPSGSSAPPGGAAGGDSPA